MTTNSNFRVKNGLEVQQDIKLNTIKLRDNAGILEAVTETTVTISPNAALYNFNDDLTDATGNTSLTLSNQTVVSDTLSKWGGFSLFVGDTTTNFNYAAISEINSGALNIGTGDYTVEGWIYIPTTSSPHNWGFMQLGTYIWGLNRSAGGGGLPSFYNGSTYPGSSINLSYDQWNHICWSRVNGVLYIGVNGVVEEIGAETTDILWNSNAMFGSDQYPNESIYGYIDDVRILKGVGLYTANYTVPAAQLQLGPDVSVVTTSPAYPSVSAFANDAGYATGTIPTAVSQLTNDAGYITTNAFDGGTFTGTVNLKGITETVVALGDTSGTPTIDASSGTVFTMSLTGDVTISSITNIVAGSSITLIITQDSTGSRLLTSTMKFAGGNKTLSTDPAAVDMINVFYDGTNYLASLVKGYA